MNTRWSFPGVRLAALFATAIASLALGAGLALAQTTYTWNQVGTAAWTLDTNWSPTRTTPAADDILVFNGGGSVTVTDVPTQTIGQLLLSGSSTVALQTVAPAKTLTIAGGTGTDLDVPSGSALNISGATTIIVSLATGATGSVGGSMNFTHSAAGPSHQLLTADASGTTFLSGSTFIQGPNNSGNAFGSTLTPNTTVFNSGATYISRSGSNPFGLPQPASKVVFQTGSLYKHEMGGAPAFSGRTYASYEQNIVGVFSATGGSPVSIDNLTVTLGTLNIGMTNTASAIKGNISVALGATLNFNPASAATMNLSGTSAQTVSNAGTLTFQPNQNLNLNNAAGLTLLSNVALGSATLTLTSGKVTTGANTLSTVGTIAGAGAGRYVFGNLQKRVTILASTGSQTFEVGGTSVYAPVNLSTTTGLANFDVLASSTDGENPNIGTSTLDATKSVNRYWSLSSSPALSFGNCDLVLNFDASDVDGGANTAAFDVEKYDSPNWTTLTEGTQGATSTQVLGVTGFSDFAIAEELSLPVHNLNTGFDYATIQLAHDAAPTLNGHVILADPGTYEEQVVLTKSLTIRGTSTASTIVKSPVTLTAFYTTPGPNNNFPVIFVNGADGTVIEDLTVDGAGRGNGNYRFVGIGWWNAGGRVTDVDIKSIEESPFSGTQHGVGIGSFNNTGGPYSLEVETTRITDFQKNAMALSGAGLTVDVHDCTAVGKGYTAVTAQNGIQVSSGAQGTVANCAISEMGYTPATFVASGVLIFGTGGPVTVSGLNGPNAITNVQAPISWYDGNGTMDGVSSVGGADFGPIFVYNSTLVPGPNGARLDAARPRPLASAIDGEQAESGLRTPNQIASSFTVSVINSCLDGTDVAGTAGIGVYTEGGPLTVSSNNNEITDWEAGLTTYGTEATLSARENSISSNVVAGYDNTGTLIAQNAEFNYWGAADGPSGDGPGTGDAVLGGNVDFTPFLTNGTDLAGGCGFQAVLTVHNIDTGLDYPTIQSAISDPLTLNGHTIVADPGTYPENVTLNKDLTLRGGQAGVAGCGRVVGAPDPATETIVTGPAPGATLLTLVTGSAGSTIDGFSFIGGTRCIESATGPIHGVSILNNHLAGFTGGAVFLNDAGTDVNVSRNNMEASSKTAGGGTMHLDTDLFDGFHLIDNCILNAPFGPGVFVDGVENVRPSAGRRPRIGGNRIENHSTNVGLNLGSRAVAFGDIAGNRIANNAFDGLQGGMRNSLITGNLFDNNGRWGLALTSFGNTTVARGAFNDTITGNTFTANDSAGLFISAAMFAGHAGSNLANYNDIVGNGAGGAGYGAVYRGTETFQVGCNWWGDINGPDYPPANPNVPGDGLFATSAVFAPWLDGSITGTPNCNQFPPVNTTTTLSSDVNPSTCGQKVNLTATVAPNTATGTVEFFDGGASIGTAPVVAGAATLSTTTLPAGHRTLTANYSGDLDHNPSASNKLVQNVHCVGSVTTVTPTPCDSMGWRRNNVLGNATVDITGTYPHAAGSLEFNSPGGSGKADYQRPNGNADLLTTLSALAVDLYRNSSSTSAAHFAPAVRLFIDNGNATDRFSYLIWEPVYNGYPVFPTDTWTTIDIFKHNFWQRAFKTVPPNLTIDLYSRTLADWLQPGTVTDGDGHVSNVVGPNARVLAYEIGVGSGWAGTFAGAADNFHIGFAQVDSVFDFEVIPTSVVLASDNNPSKFGTKINFTATVTPSAATGTVEFFDGASSLGTAPVVGGVATLSVTNLTNGSHSITARYSGDACHTASASNKVDQVVADMNCPIVTVVAPNAPLQILVVGSKYFIQWTAVDDKGVDSIDVNLSRDNGTTWESIADNIPNSGSYSWIVTGPGTNVDAIPVFSALIEITAKDAAGNTCGDRSDNPFAIYDLATETLLSLFQAEPIDAGIQVRWMFGDPDQISSVSVERAISAQGPWSAVTLDQSREGDMFVGLDRTVVTGQTYFYRLQAALRAGGSLTFGPLSGTAGLAIREFALTQLAPNPSPGRTRISYTVPREAQVRLSVLDVQGREVAVLVNGVSRPGSYQAAWNGMTDRGAAPAGLYFIQLTTPAGRMVKRLALNP